MSLSIFYYSYGALIYTFYLNFSQLFFMFQSISHTGQDCMLHSMNESLPYSIRVLIWIDTKSYKSCIHTQSSDFYMYKQCNVLKCDINNELCILIIQDKNTCSIIIYIVVSGPKLKIIKPFMNLFTFFVTDKTQK